MNIIISNWKKKIFDNIKDKSNNLILRDYRIFFAEIKNKNKHIKGENAIWWSDIIIGHMRASENYYIDGTFY
jgi:hypothetical protein